jgi:hypothetical protein
MIQLNPRHFRELQRRSAVWVIVLLVSAVSFLLFVTGCKRGKTGSVLDGIPKQTTDEEYRAVTPGDMLVCDVRTSRIEFNNAGPTGGQIDGLECIDKAGKTRDIKLNFAAMDRGEIETQDFGNIRLKSTNGVGTFTMFMTESQIKKLQTFLGF